MVVALIGRNWWYDQRLSAYDHWISSKMEIGIVYTEGNVCKDTKIMSCKARLKHVSSMKTRVSKQFFDLLLGPNYPVEAINPSSIPLNKSELH